MSETKSERIIPVGTILKSGNMVCRVTDYNNLTGLYKTTLFLLNGEPTYDNFAHMWVVLSEEWTELTELEKALL